MILFIKHYSRLIRGQSEHSRPCPNSSSFAGHVKYLYDTKLNDLYKIGSSYY